MNKFNQWITNFFNTKWIFITLVGVIGFFSLVQLIMFGVKDDFTVEWFFGNPITSFGSHAWLGWLIINLGFMGSCLTLSGEIFLVRGKKKFLPIVLVGQIMLIVYGVCSGLWFIVIDYIFYCVIGIIHYKHWTNETKKENTMTTKSYICITLFAFAYLTAALSLTLNFSNIDTKPILDPLISTLVIFGWFNITRKNRWGYLAFLLTDILGILMFVLIASWGVAASYIIYIIFDFSGFTIWANWNSPGINIDKIVEHHYPIE